MKRPSASWAMMDFNPRFPQGKRQKLFNEFKMTRQFQSTLPAREATTAAGPSMSVVNQFQSTLPAREATEDIDQDSALASISIHASRKGSDGAIDHLLLLSVNFNPRFPQGKRHYHQNLQRPAGKISIHASRKGSDPPPFPFSSGRHNFNPRFPQGKRLK